MPKRADEFAFGAVQRSHDALLVATLAVFADHINAFRPSTRPQCSFQYRIGQGWIPVRRVDQRGRASANFAFGEAESVLSELVPADDAILDVGDDDWMRQLFKDKGILPQRAQL